MDISDINQQFREFIDQGIKEEALKELFCLIPNTDDQDPHSLESSTRCILEVSNLVDDTYPHLNRGERLQKKYTIMARLLEIKVHDLAASN